MIHVQREGDRAVIDVRELVKKGHHPKGEIFQYVKEAPVGTLLEIHVPHRAQPLVSGLSALGLNVIVKELSMDHFLLRTVKLIDS
ncbi:MAG TPA: amino acid decarboxylase [Bacillales bacterium]|nr:amino acid decarboxylase [Bacillales bacterium]